MSRLRDILLGDDDSGFTHVGSIEAPGLSSSAASAAEARRLADAAIERVFPASAERPPEPAPES